MPNVQEHAPSPAGARSEPSVEPQTREEGENKAAGGGCCDSSCSESLFSGERVEGPDGKGYWMFHGSINDFHAHEAANVLSPRLRDHDGSLRVRCVVSAGASTTRPEPIELGTTVGAPPEKEALDAHWDEGGYLTMEGGYVLHVVGAVPDLGI
jgi:hypothetical protein